MSPVSRGRKQKKTKKRAGSPGSGLTRPMGSRPRPAWFDPAIKAVLGGTEAVDSASGPRELEDATAELLGAELYRVLREDRDGLWFDWWFAELVTAAAHQGASRLLQGLAAIGTPPLAQKAVAAHRRLHGKTTLPKVTATGEVFRMRDAYGTRFAVLAGFSDGTFLFDVDTSRGARLVGGRVHDDVTQAAAAWLATIGDTAGETEPRPVEDMRDLLCLVHLDIGDNEIMGDESRAVMDGWFRVRRRIDDLGAGLRKRGRRLPPAESLFNDIDTSQMTDDFCEWYFSLHGTEPDMDAVHALAEEWMEGALPETWFSVSPDRIAFQRTLIGDWLPDHPLTLAVTSLLPEWVTWLGRDLPAQLRERVEAAVTAH
jgi:hypothetical protein